MVIWLIGLSGSGKTTVGKEVFRIWKKKSPQTIFLDGDEVRDIFSNENYSRDYTLKGRRLNAERISRLCLWLDNYNINIVASVLSVFPDMQDWNRKNFKKYFQVFLDVPMNILVKRDTKNLYKEALSGKIKNVVGVDIDFPKPKNSNLILTQTKSQMTVDFCVKEILKKSGIINENKS